MKTNTPTYTSVLAVLLASVLMLSALTSCEEEKPRTEGSSVQATNPYTNESVFSETKKKIQDNPKDADLWYHLADLYDRNGQYSEAIDAYKKVIELKPDMGYAHFKMGTAYDRLNKPNEAIAALEKATKLMPDYAVAYNNLGVAYGKLGRIKDEITVLKKAVELRPKYAAARYNLGISYLKDSNKQASKKQYEALRTIDEGAAEALQKAINSAP